MSIWWQTGMIEAEVIYDRLQNVDHSHPTPSESDWREPPCQGGISPHTELWRHSHRAADLWARPITLSGFARVHWTLTKQFQAAYFQVIEIHIHIQINQQCQIASLIHEVHFSNIIIHEQFVQDIYSGPRRFGSGVRIHRTPSSHLNQIKTFPRFPTSQSLESYIANPIILQTSIFED